MKPKTLLRDLGVALIVVVVFAVFSFLLLFVGFLPVKWTDEEPQHRYH